MGVTIALPLLDAMVPALSSVTHAAGKTVRRLGIVYVPNGIAMQYWTPSNGGTDFELSPILKPLEPMRDRVVVVSGLNGQRNAAAQSSHAAASTRFLTGVPGRQTAEGMEAGASIDQLVARTVGEQTPLASLELAVDARDISGSCDGASCAFLNTVSWSSTTTALPTEHDPRVVFERMFGESGSTDQSVRLASLRRHRSILDSITEAVGDLGRGLGPSDRSKIDEYLAAVRDIERRIQAAEQRGATEVPLVEQPSGIPEAFEEKVRLMFDLQVLAYRADITRVITFMVGREFSGRTYPQVGVSEAHHPLSHHQNDPEKIAQLARIDTYHMSLFAEYLDKLRATPDGDGSLLDDLLLLYGSGISDGNRHDSDNLPLVLLGGRLKGERHLRFDGEPAANLLMSILDNMGVATGKVANSERALPLDTLSGL
jgi:hypothetical protein